MKSKDCYDFLIVGAGPAGCFSAMRLADNGYSVAVLEKEPQYNRKVCGDGLSIECICLLKDLGFPVNRFEESGAIRINKYVFIQNGQETNRLLKEDELAYGLTRSCTDTIFREYAAEKLGIDFFYQYKVNNILFKEGYYRIDDFVAKKVILANGVSRSIKINQIPFFSNRKQAFGLFAVIQTDKKVDSPFFLFDYDFSKSNTYAWVFCISPYAYNVGMWEKHPHQVGKRDLENYLGKKAKNYFCGNIINQSPFKGAYMGIGEPVESCFEGVYVIGDAANTCNRVSGEGISMAVRSANDLLDRIL